MITITIGSSNMMTITRKIDGVVRHIALTDNEIYCAKNEWEVQNIIQNLEAEIIHSGKKIPHQEDLRKIAEKISIELSSDEYIYEEADMKEYRLIQEEVSKLK